MEGKINENGLPVQNSSLDIESDKKTSAKMLLRRSLIYILGSFILAMGIAFTVKADLGLSPINTLPFAVSCVTGADFGFMVTVVYSNFVLVQILILKRDFMLKNLLQIVISILFGFFVSLSENILFLVTAQNYPVRLFFLALGLFLIGLGIMLYLAADLVPQPPEGLLLAIQKKSGWKFSNIKIGFDCTILIIALLFALLSGAGLAGIREGTLISALTLGKIIALFSKLLYKPVTKFCFMSDRMQDDLT